MERKYKNKSLAYNASLNGIKQACSILFPFISFVYCSRILGADSIGAYSFGQSIISYFLLIAALGIPSYAIREGARLRDNENCLHVFINEVFSINCVTTIISYILLVVCLLNIDKLESYKIIILIQSIQIILTTLGTDWINSIFEDYAYLAIRYIIIQVIAMFCLVIFVRNSSDIYAYSLITALSNAGGNVLNWFYLRKTYSIKPVFLRKMRLKRHLKPIIILFCNSIAVIIYMNADITMLGFFKSDNCVGVYTVSSKIYSMVKTLINAVTMVTVPRFSYYIANKKNDEYRRDLSKVFHVLFVIILPCIIGIFLEAEKIILFIAGKEYISGINVVKILSISLLFAIYACFFSYSILVPNCLEKKFLVATIIAAITNILLNFIFIPRLGINGAAITTLIAEILVCFVSAIYSSKVIHFRIQMLDILKCVISCIGIVFSCGVIDRVITDYRIALVLDITMSVIVYLLLLYWLKNKVVMEMIQSMRDKKVKKKK